MTDVHVYVGQPPRDFAFFCFLHVCGAVVADDADSSSCYQFQIIERVPSGTSSNMEPSKENVIDGHEVQLRYLMYNSAQCSLTSDILLCLIEVGSVL